MCVCDHKSFLELVYCLMKEIHLKKHTFFNACIQGASQIAEGVVSPCKYDISLKIQKVQEDILISLIHFVVPTLSGQPSPSSHPAIYLINLKLFLKTKQAKPKFFYPASSEF